MAVAGLHNVSAFGPAFLDESQSRPWGDERESGPRTQASTLFQMWRELEGEHAVSSPSYRSRRKMDGSGSDCLSTPRSIGLGSDNGDDISQVTDEFDNHRGFTGSEDNKSVISEQSSDLGEVERERVRQIFREWMNNGSVGHSSYNRSGQWLGENECERVRVIREWVQMTTQQRNNCGSLRDDQIEQVRDGLVIDHPEIGARRPIRRLCGRQTLLDLLLRAQNERKRELVGLAEQRPVSDFAHRNRIQALLRGRFLRNERSVLDERPSSMAATELGLLKQRQTVSDLREGFLTKLDNSASTSVNSVEPDSTCHDEKNSESDSRCTESEVRRVLTSSDLENAVDRTRGPHELEVQVTEAENPVMENEPEVLDEIEFSSSGHGEQINAIITNESSLESNGINHRGPLEVYNENHETRSGASFVREVDDHTTTDLEGNTNEETHTHDALAQVEEFEESEIEIEESGWQQLNTVAFTEWADNNVEDQDHMQESQDDWPSHDLQEAIDSWLDIPSEDVSSSLGRIDTFYFPDDDNVQSMELRELFSRRRVSSLLRSGFRASLDQVLQSHVERLGHASGDWDMDNTSSPVMIEQDEEQLNGDQTFALSDGVERNQFASEQLWDEEMQDANWPPLNSNQQLGTEWEVINELRIDMARLQQRMNNMQSMLEACMDMQIELQRSVRQEVSAALNRSFFSRDESQDNHNMIRDESKWDHIRRGICCLCRDSKIDSLLYRCGHMCICSKCAENLVQCVGKCPMCEAPVVEVVRAYFSQS